MHEKTACVLCELTRERDTSKVWILKRTEQAYVVLNKYPYNSGHLMVVPIKHTARLSDLSEPELLEIHRLIRDGISALEQVMKPQGFNVGMNLGEAGGAGIRDHLHYHIVPRWSGDTNYMPVLGQTKVLPESLDDTFKRLVSHF